MTEIPDEFKEFAKAKQTQLLNNVLTSAAAGVMLANGVALLCGDASGAVLAETLTAQLPLLALTAAASAISGALAK
jgi:hypothetical protein